MVPMWEGSPVVDTTGEEVKYEVVVEMVTEFDALGIPKWSSVLRLEGKEALRDLPGLLKRLPDDRYRVYLEETKGEKLVEKRLIREVVIRAGKPTELGESMGEGPDEVGNPEGPQPGENRPPAPLPLDPASGSSDTMAVPIPEPTALPDESTIRRTGAAAAAVVAPLTASIWQDRIDQAISKHSERLLSKAARMYRRTGPKPKRKT
jgi:hypothetical protein